MIIEDPQDCASLSLSHEFTTKCFGKSCLITYHTGLFPRTWFPGSAPLREDEIMHGLFCSIGAGRADCCPARRRRFMSRAGSRSRSKLWAASSSATNLTDAPVGRTPRLTMAPSLATLYYNFTDMWGVSVSGLQAGRSRAATRSAPQGRPSDSHHGRLRCV